MKEEFLVGIGYRSPLAFWNLCGKIVQPMDFHILTFVFVVERRAKKKKGHVFCLFEGGFLRMPMASSTKTHHLHIFEASDCYVR
jgi:hypothetical protein